MSKTNLDEKKKSEDLLINSSNQNKSTQSDLDAIKEEENTPESNDVKTEAKLKKKTEQDNDETKFDKFETGAYSWYYWGQQLGKNIGIFLENNPITQKYLKPILLGAYRGVTEVIPNWIKSLFPDKNPTPADPKDTTQQPDANPAPKPADSGKTNPLKNDFSDKDKDTKNARDTNVDPNARPGDTPQFDHATKNDPSLAARATPDASPEPDRKVGQDLDEKARADQDNSKPRPGSKP